MKTPGQSICSISGDDEFAVAEDARSYIEARLRPEDRVLGLEVIEGNADVIEQGQQIIARTLESLMTFSFLGGNKVVWLRDTNLLVDGVVPRSELIKERLAGFLAALKAGLPNGHCFLITARAIDGRTALARYLKETGTWIEHSIPDRGQAAERDVRQRMEERCRECGLELAADAETAFLERTGGDTRAMVNELEKLHLYLGDRKSATAADVEAIVSRSRSVPFWDLADAVGRRDLAGAVNVLRQLLFQREPWMLLMSGLENRFRELAIFREALDQKWAELSNQGGRAQLVWRELPDAVAALYDDLEKDPRGLNPYRAMLLAQQASRYSMAEIRRCQNLILATYQRLVSGSVSESILLELLLVNLMARRTAPARARS